MKWFIGISVAIMCFCFGVYYGQTSIDPQIEVKYIPYPVEHVKTIHTTTTTAQRIEVPVPIHNKPGYYEFESKREFKDYLQWYRNERMVNHGPKQCEDYADDFVKQAFADDYFVKSAYFWVDKYTRHEAVAVPIGNKVYMADIAAGCMEFYAYED